MDRLEKYKRGWRSGLPETECGAGSKFENTKEIRKFIESNIKKYQIKTIADIGAGDLNWIKRTNLNGAEYYGYDLYPRHNEVQQFDLLENIAPKADLLLCIYVINHMSFEDAHLAFNNLLLSKSKYIILTDHNNDYFKLPIRFDESIEIFSGNKQKRRLGIFLNENYYSD